MAVSLYDLSVASYLQGIPATLAVLEKGATHAAANGIALDDLVQARVHADMAPLHFQVVSVVHHSVGAIKGVLSGEFGPPNGYAEMDYPGLQAFLKEALAELKQLDPAVFEACAGGSVAFKLGGNVIPFTTENFLLSFSVPNFFFHATTAYDILRMRGVALGKRDFLGALRIGAPDAAGG